MSIAGLHSLVLVDHAQCDRLAEYLAGVVIPPDREDSSLPGLPKHLIGNFLFALVAICHQTSPRDRLPLEGFVRGVRRRGWDYLFARYEEAAQHDPLLVTPERWARLTTNDVRQLFRDRELGDRLSEPERRAMLLQDLGRRMLSQRWKVADQFYHHCAGRISVGDPNLLDTLKHFRAYNDPVRKKSVFFLALMRNSGLWQYIDDESLGPPVDYHEVRGHLRMGTVTIADSGLLTKVHTGQPVTVDEDLAIRRGVYDAIMYVSDRSGVRNPSQLHYLFWNLFRSVCTAVAPQCSFINTNNSLPTRYGHLLVSKEGRRCPFSSFCQSTGILNPIREHVFETDYY